MNSPDNPLIRPRNPFERRVVQAVAAAKPRMSVGIVEKPLPGGTSLTPLKTRRSSVATDVHPFYIRDSGLIHAGTVRGEIPTLDGDPIGEAGNELTLSGDFFVYIQVVFDLVFGSHFFLTSAELVDTDPVTIVTNATPLSDDLDLTGLTLTTYRLIAQVYGGAVMRTQPTTTNMNLSVCDAGDGTEGGRNATATWTPAGI